MTASATGQYCAIDLAPLSDEEKIRVGLASCCFGCGQTIQSIVARQNGFVIEQVEDGWRFVCHECEPVDLAKFDGAETVKVPELN